MLGAMAARSSGSSRWLRSGSVVDGAKLLLSLGRYAAGIGMLTEGPADQLGRLAYYA